MLAACVAAAVCAATLGSAAFVLGVWFCCRGVFPFAFDLGWGPLLLAAWYCSRFLFPWLLLGLVLVGFVIGSAPFIVLFVIS